MKFYIKYKKYPTIMTASSATMKERGNLKMKIADLQPVQFMILNIS
jgi:hypothetical protein